MLIIIDTDIVFRWITAYLLADFITGVGHWIEDTYFDETFDYFSFVPYIGDKLNKFAVDVIVFNREHHKYPNKFSDSWYENIEATLPLALFGFTVNYILNTYILGWNFDLSNYFMWAFVCSVNLVHKYNHETILNRPTLFTILQHIGFLQNREQHQAHHKINKEHTFNICYCILTPYLNFFLDRYKFWRGLEHIVLQTTGVKPRAFEDKVKDKKSSPESNTESKIVSKETDDFSSKLEKVNELKERHFIAPKNDS